MTVVVVGAGPAGLEAAAAARAAGARVRVLDSSPAVGGQYWRARADGSAPPGQHGWARFTALRRALEQDPNVRLETEVHVFAVETDDDRVVLDVVHGPADGTGRRVERLVPTSVVIATGAHDRVLPVPGWTLPGVVTAGAAQALAKADGVAVGRRVVVAGSGPFLLPVSVSLASAGATVAAVLEAGTARHLAATWWRRPAGLLAAGAKASELAGYAWHHARRRVPWRPGRGVVAIHGTSEVEAVTTARLDDDWRPVAGTEEVIACDAVCLGHGFVPRLEVAIAAGCALDDRRFVRTDDDQRTSDPRVFAAGEITGIGGADLARAQGRVAGWCAAGGDPGARLPSAARRRRARLTDFAGRMESAHRIGDGWTGWLTPDTIVCRCEEVTAQQLTGVADLTSASGWRAVKLASRACLGSCQGRVCGRVVEELLRPWLPPDDVGTDRRPVIAPVRLGEIASAPLVPENTTPPRKEPLP